MNHFLKLVALILVVFASMAGTATSWAAEPINTLEKKGLFGYSASGIAIRGYDTVAYFTQGRPIEGSESFSSQWHGATWRFASGDNLELFEADPEKYAPQFGGYCAFGVAEGALVKIEPERWTIVGGKLYLNYDRKVQKLWEEDIAGYIAKANSTFDTLLASD